MDINVKGKLIMATDMKKAPKHYTSLNAIHRKRKSDYFVNFKRGELFDVLLEEELIHKLDEEEAKKRGKNYGGYFITSKGDKFFNETAKDDPNVENYEYNMNGNSGTTIYVKDDYIPQFFSLLENLGLPITYLPRENRDEEVGETVTTNEDTTQRPLDLSDTFNMPEPNDVRQIPLNLEGVSLDDKSLLLDIRQQAEKQTLLLEELLKAQRATYLLMAKDK